MADEKIPSPWEIQKDISDYLKRKYGDRVIIPPQPDLVGDSGGDRTQREEPPLNIDFDLKPEELEAYLKQYVVNQDEAIEVLATKICTHFNRMRLEMSPGGPGELVGNIKNNVLMIGPTGVGKTFIVKLIAKKIGVPFVKGDATKFSETGYVGGDVEDLVRDLVREADGNIRLAECGIIYLDEIDKIASSGTVYGPDVSRTGVQRNLLKLMEESEVDLKTPHDLAAQMEAAMEAQRTGKVTRKKVNTKNILFVVSGAFPELEDIIRKRLKQQPIGFKSEKSEPLANLDRQALLKVVRSEDLIKYGFESEFVGRLPVVVCLNDLSVEDLYRIVKNPNSVVVQAKKRDFVAYGIELEFEDEALRRIAERAYAERTGARGLVSAMERVLIKFEKKLPSTDIKKLTVTAAMVDNPGEELEKLLRQHAIKAVQKRLLASTGVVVTFTDKAIEMISQMAKEQGHPFEAVCNELLKDYEYGVKLLNRAEFKVDEKVVADPKGRLEELIREAYHRRSQQK
ncbi:MAG: AAA family ATPase [bacterium]|jgi:endopeptidase Clp ATP-binding regulatory subunit ClpX|nr:AAA family ATPase [candidate division KSB1 bacterium]MDH7558701.1 AAA family ATPase [bacterium]